MVTAAVVLLAAILVLAMVLVIGRRFTWHDVTGEPHRLAARLAAALAK